MFFRSGSTSLLGGSRASPHLYSLHNIPLLVKIITQLGSAGLIRISSVNLHHFLSKPKFSSEIGRLITGNKIEKWNSCGVQDAIKADQCSNVVNMNSTTNIRTKPWKLSFITVNYIPYVRVDSSMPPKSSEKSLDISTSIYTHIQTPFHLLLDNFAVKLIQMLIDDWSMNKLLCCHGHQYPFHNIKITLW